MIFPSCPCATLRTRFCDLFDTLLERPVLFTSASLQPQTSWISRDLAPLLHACALQKFASINLLHIAFQTSTCFHSPRLHAMSFHSLPPATLTHQLSVRFFSLRYCTHRASAHFSLPRSHAPDINQSRCLAACQHCLCVRASALRVSRFHVLLSALNCSRVLAAARPSQHAGALF